MKYVIVLCSNFFIKLWYINTKLTKYIVCTVVFVENTYLTYCSLKKCIFLFSMLCLELILLFTLMKCVCCRNVTHPLQLCSQIMHVFLHPGQMMQVVSNILGSTQFAQLVTSHSAYDETSTKSNRVKIDGLFYPNFM